MTVQIARRLFTTTEYEEMVSAGILTEDDKVELLNGEIVEMTPIGIAHNAAVDRLNRLLGQATGTDAIVRVQSSIRLDDRSEPEPDVSLLKPRDDFYGDTHPGPSDILLLIEVADTTLDFDRSVKLPLYARAGIPEVWLVDLNGGCVEVHSMARSSSFLQIRLHYRGDMLETSVHILSSVAVVDILGPSRGRSPMTVQIVRHLFTTVEYEEMVSAGILTEDDKVELISGKILQKAPISSADAACRSRLIHLLVPNFGSRAIVGVQDPVRLDEQSMPEPDVILLKPRDDFYANDYPGPSDIILLIEVADTSLDFDPSVKLPLYAGVGIPEVWLVDLNGGCVEVHSMARGSSFRLMRLYERGDMLETSVQVLSPIAVVDILGA